MPKAYRLIPPKTAKNLLISFILLLIKDFWICYGGSHETEKNYPAIYFSRFLACCCAVSADPLNNWHWRNPLPNGNPLPGADNLYGIVFTNGQFFAVGANGIEFTSPDGTNWTQSTTATSNQLNDIFYDNGQFIAVGNNGALETSVNGTNWVLQNSGTSASLSSVAYGNGEYVAVGGSAIIASPNGVTWSPATSGPGGASQVAGSSSGFVAVNGSTNDYFSANGLSWTTNTLTAPGVSFNGSKLQAPFVVFSKGSFLIAAWRFASSLSADVFVFASSDGQNWTTNIVGNESTSPQGTFSFSFSLLGNGNAVFVGYADTVFFLSSSNNVNWSFNDIDLYSPQINAGAYGNGLYAFVKSTSTIYTSPDTVNWATQQFNPPAAVGPTSTFNSITFSNGLYVAATSGSFVNSTNGQVYTVESNTPSLSTVITYGTNFVGVGSGGAVYTSTNGFSWTQRNSGTADNLHGVVAGSNLLVAVGDNGAVQTSPSGTIWTSRSSGTSLPLYGVAYSNGLYVAVGQEGTAVTSPDGINWTVQYSGVLSNLFSVTYGSAGFLAAGSGGTILTSPDGVNWTTRNVGATGGQTLYGSGFLNGRFDVVGYGGTVLESDPVPPLFALQMHARPFQNVFTLFATPGMSFRVLSSPNFNPASWSTAASINNAAAITLWTNTAIGGGQCFFRLVSP